MTTQEKPVHAIGYCRVSTVEQAEQGSSLDVQEATLRAEAERRGWMIDIVREEGRSGKNLRRPGLEEALRRLDDGSAQVLLAVRLDRISRSVADFAELTKRARRSGWRLVLLSPSLDTEDPAGAFASHILAAAAEYERALIAARTREGMAHRQALGGRVGRPRNVPAEVEARIRTDRANGHSLRAIATRLNADGVPTAAGGTWYASTVKVILERDAP